MQVKKNTGITIVNYPFVFLLFLLSIKKGGFYKTDSMGIELMIIFLGFCFVGYQYVLLWKKKEETYTWDVVGILLAMMPICYALPILLVTYSDQSDSIGEMMRWLCVYLLYHIIKVTGDNKIWKIAIVGVATLSCIVGIDGIGCRYLQPLLQHLSSGYLSSDLTRMSGTIQYANVFAILIAIAGVFVWEYWLTYCHVPKEKKQKNRTRIAYVLFAVFSYSIVLSGSRSVLALYGASCLLLLWKERKHRRENLVFLFMTGIMIGLIVTVMTQMMAKYSFGVYLVFGLSLVILWMVDILFSYLQESANTITIGKLSLWQVLALGLPAITILYIIIGLNMSQPLVVSATTQEKLIIRNLYEIQPGVENHIAFHVTDLEKDSHYEISMYAIKEDYSSEKIRTFRYLNTVEGNFYEDTILEENVKYISLYITCQTGKIQVDSFTLNDQQQTLSYLLLPDDVVIRVQDVFHGSPSVRDRMLYLQDAFRIASKSPLRMLIGSGGEAFLHQYPSVQQYPYTSSEVHNGYVQVFVEAGLLGSSIFILCILIAIKRSQYNVNTIALSMLVLQILFDLSLSYFLMMLILAILLAILPEKERKKKKWNKGCIMIGLGYLLLTTGIAGYCLVKQNMAYHMRIPKYTSEQLDRTKQQQVLVLMERRVQLDPTEKAYRKELQRAYVTYLSLVPEEKERQPDIQKMDQNAQEMIDNSPDDTNVMLFLAEQYLERMKLGETEEQYEKDSIRIQQLLQGIKVNIKIPMKQQEKLLEIHTKIGKEIQSWNDYDISMALQKLQQYLQNNTENTLTD